MKLSPQRVNEICKNDDEIAGYFNQLLDVIDRQAEMLQQQAIIINQQSEQIVKLEKRVHELERQVGQNSNNSSKPPSSDGMRKPSNTRVSGGKKGAPKGHPGKTLSAVLNPDETVLLMLNACTHCNASLEQVTPFGYERRSSI
jgi:uncharacterized coiled-coil protein SlyX